ncbi:MAG TPA: branched-chain amino acid ABC transporter permease [Methylomirabilota bacterium]|nr:branched-chain amino acid ABC transporter permease [Methylomirabilota bacterium]
MPWPLLSGLSAVSRAALVGLLIAGLIAFGLAADEYLLDIGVLVGVYTILGLGLSIVIGQAGLLDLGYIAFYAIGAYWTALLSTHWGVSFWILLPTSAVLAALFGVVLGYPTLRLRGDYLAIVTLGFGEIIRITLNNWRELTNGPMGIMGVPHPTIAVPGLGVLDFGLKVRAYYFFVLALAAMTVFVVRRLVHSRIGLAWKAIREDELAAGAMGVDVRRAKLLAFGLGAAFAGLAGSFFAGRAGFVSPESFTFAESVLVVCIVVIGGAGSLAGVIVGAVVFIALPELLREAARYRMLAFGVAMVTLALVRPQGLLGRTWIGEERDEDRAPEGEAAPGLPSRV